MKLYFTYAKMHLKTILEYKKSFILSFLSQIFVVFTYYFSILALFNKFSNLKGFSLYEVLLTFSIIQIGFSVSETFFRGVDQFDTLIIDGSYDRLLLKPVGMLKQVLCYKIDYVKLCRLLQGIVVFIIAVNNLDIEWNIIKILVLISMILGCILLFFSLFLISASYCFYTVQGLEVRNLLVDGGKHMAQYPIGIFKKGLVFIFTFIIPYGCVNYYPLLYILGRGNLMYAVSPFVIILFFLFSLLIFKIGSKHYTSVGS